MNRPLIFKLLPERFKQSVFFWCYHPVSKRWHPLFKGASLRFAPSIKMDLLSTDSMHGSIAFTGSYEDSLSRHVVRLARSGGTMVDVGANAGYFSLIWAAVNPGNYCMAFEASPRNIQLLRSNIQANDLVDRIKLYEFAAGLQNGILEFDVGPLEQTGWGGVALKSGPNTIQVSVKRLDEVIDCKTTIDFMKIDVEGADTWVLMGAEKLLKEKSVKEIHFEQNKPRLHQLGIKENEAADFLESVGYKASALSDSTSDIVDWQALPV